MKILFVDSGASGFHLRYAYDIHNTLIKDFGYTAHHVSPQNLSPRLISQFHPDIMLVVHGTRTPLNLIQAAKAQGVTTILWLVEDPYEIDHHRGEMVESYDYIFTNEKLAVNEYNHPKVFYLPWCCNPRVHKRIPVTGDYISDICFVGMGFANRVNVLNAVAPFLKQFNLKLIGNWSRWGVELHPHLRKSVIPVIDNFWEVQKYYNGARISLNIHRDPIDPPAGNSRGISAISPNDRTFALAGCGVFQIVDNTRPGLWEYFTEEEIISFNNPDELAQKIEYFISKPEVREAIGTMAQKKAYAQHTFIHRLSEIFKIIRSSTVHKETSIPVVYRYISIGQYSSNVSMKR